MITINGPLATKAGKTNKKMDKRSLLKPTFVQNRSIF